MCSTKTSGDKRTRDGDGNSSDVRESGAHKALRQATSVDLRDTRVVEGPVPFPAPGERRHVSRSPIHLGNSMFSFPACLSTHAVNCDVETCMKRVYAEIRENAENATPVCESGKCRTGKRGKRPCMEHRVGYCLGPLSFAAIAEWI